ncbi:MAG: hypothetical protein ACUVQX_05665 [Candidatus Bathycorpusculaceae bacterium]
MQHTLKRLEETLKHVLEKKEISLQDLKKDLKSLEESFTFLSRKWNLEILYALFLINSIGFGELKREGV